MMVIRFSGRYSLPLTLAMVWLHRGCPLISLDLDDYGGTGISIGDENVPVDEIGQMLINFRGGGTCCPAAYAPRTIDGTVWGAPPVDEEARVGGQRHRVRA